MGRVRTYITNQLASRGVVVGSNGLGGLVYALKSESELIEIAQLEIADDSLTVSIELDAVGLREFGLEAHACAIRAAANVQTRRPFRR